MQAIAALAKCVLSLRPAMAARDGHELDSLHLCSLRGTHVRCRRIPPSVWLCGMRLKLSGRGPMPLGSSTMPVSAGPAHGPGDQSSDLYSKKLRGNGTYVNWVISVKIGFRFIITNFVVHD